MDECQKLLMPEGILSKVLQQYEYRPAQLEMAEAVSNALSEKKTLLIEAATGTGKTWAYLIPAILSGQKVVVSTGTLTLQDQLCNKDLPFLSKTLPRPFSFCMMKGKSNYLCLHRFYESLRQSTFSGFGISSEMEKIQEWAMTTKSGDRSELTGLSEASQAWQEVSIKGESCLGGQCPEYSRCYLTRIKQEAAASDVVVVNHHLFFADLSLKNQGYGEILPHYHGVIFDEAHLLEEVATQFFGVSLSHHRVDDFVRDAESALRYGQKIDSACFEQCKLLVQYASQYFKFFSKGPERYRLRKADFTAEIQTAGFELIQSFKHFGRLIEKLELKSDAIKAISERIALILTDLALFVDEKEAVSDRVFWVEHRRSGVFLHASPLDVSDTLKERLFSGDRAVILTSATLSARENFEFIKSRLGISFADEKKLGTAFCYEKQALLYLPEHLPAPASEKFILEISKEIIQILNQSQGRAFILFTSWKNLEAVYQQIKDHVPYRLLKQGDQPKHALITLFKKEKSSVLLGTTSFWQGVDVEGEALSCVIIDKLPFASPGDPMTAARIEVLQEQQKDPFYHYQIPLAILSLRQGIGRLIRNSKDRGLIVILDHRITKKGYGKLFLDSLPPAPKTADFKQVVSFFKQYPS